MRVTGKPLITTEDQLCLAFIYFDFDHGRRVREGLDNLALSGLSGNRLQL